MNTNVLSKNETLEGALTPAETLSESAGLNDGRSEPLPLSITPTYLPPICTLPPELLLRIFKYCTPASWASWTDHARWFSFSQVCHFWRQISLGDPSLWVRPCLNRLESTREMVARARTLPLDTALYHLDVPRRREAAYFLLTKISTVKSLTIWADEDEVVRLLTAAAEHGPARSLRSIRLRCDIPNPLWPHARRSHRNVEPGYFPELDVLLAASPHIQELELQCCMPYALCNPLNRLTSLTIDNSFAPYSQRPTADVMSLLKSTPMLTCLSIRVALAPPMSQCYVQSIPVPLPSYDTSSVELPHLVCLELSDDLHLVMNTLSILHVPSLTHMNISNTDYYAPSLAALETLIPYAESWLRQSDVPVVRGLTIRCSEGPSESSPQTVIVRANAGALSLVLNLSMKHSQAHSFLYAMQRQFPHNIWSLILKNERITGMLQDEGDESGSVPPAPSESDDS